MPVRSRAMRYASPKRRPPPPRRESRDVYCYFDDDVKVHAPFDAIRLAKKLASGKAC